MATPKEFGKNLLGSGHFSIVDGELHVNNSEESATYLEADKKTVF